MPFSWGLCPPAPPEIVAANWTAASSKQPKPGANRPRTSRVFQSPHKRIDKDDSLPKKPQKLCEGPDHNSPLSDMRKGGKEALPPESGGLDMVNVVIGATETP